MVATQQPPTPIRPTQGSVPPVSNASTLAALMMTAAVGSGASDPLTMAAFGALPSATQLPIEQQQALAVALYQSLLARSNQSDFGGAAGAGPVGSLAQQIAQLLPPGGRLGVGSHVAQAQLGGSDGGDTPHRRDHHAPTVRCYRCQGLGHVARLCPTKPKNRRRLRGLAGLDMLPPGGAAALMAMTPSQRMSYLLANAEGGSGQTSASLDVSGASGGGDASFEDESASFGGPETLAAAWAATAATSDAPLDHSLMLNTSAQSLSFSGSTTAASAAPSSTMATSSSNGSVANAPQPHRVNSNGATTQQASPQMSPSSQHTSHSLTELMMLDAGVPGRKPGPPTSLQLPPGTSPVRGTPDGVPPPQQPLVIQQQPLGVSRALATTTASVTPSTDDKVATFHKALSQLSLSSCSGGGNNANATPPLLVHSAGDYTWLPQPPPAYAWSPAMGLAPALPTRFGPVTAGVPATPSSAALGIAGQSAPYFGGQYAQAPSAAAGRGLSYSAISPANGLIGRPGTSCAPAAGAGRTLFGAAPPHATNGHAGIPMPPPLGRGAGATTMGQPLQVRPLSQSSNGLPPSPTAPFTCGASSRGQPPSLVPSPVPLPGPSTSPAGVSPRQQPPPGLGPIGSRPTVSAPGQALSAGTSVPQQRQAAVWSAGPSAASAPLPHAPSPSAPFPAHQPQAQPQLWTPPTKAATSAPPGRASAFPPTASLGMGPTSGVAGGFAVQPVFGSGSMPSAQQQPSLAPASMAALNAAAQQQQTGGLPFTCPPGMPPQQFMMMCMMALMQQQHQQQHTSIGQPALGQATFAMVPPFSYQPTFAPGAPPMQAVSPPQEPSLQQCQQSPMSQQSLFCGAGRGPFGEAGAGTPDKATATAVAPGASASNGLASPPPLVGQPSQGGSGGGSATNSFASSGERHSPNLAGTAPLASELDPLGTGSSGVPTASHGSHTHRHHGHHTHHHHHHHVRESGSTALAVVAGDAVSVAPSVDASGVDVAAADGTNKSSSQHRVHRHHHRRHAHASASHPHSGSPSMSPSPARSGQLGLPPTPEVGCSGVLAGAPAPSSEISGPATLPGSAEAQASALAAVMAGPFGTASILEFSGGANGGLGMAGPALVPPPAAAL